MIGNAGSGETIYALSSGGVPSGVAVVRLSGERVRSALEAMAGGVPPARRLVRADLRGPGGDLLDQALAVFFPGPASFTGEDCAEFHLHGGKAVVQAVTGALGAMPGLRMAEPGEFTRRAFVHGKLDLTAAEGIGDLVAAETEAQRQWALHVSSGGLATLFDGWRTRIVECRSMIEAELDFADEEDAPDAVLEPVLRAAAGLEEEIRGHLRRAHPAEILRDGFAVVVLGPPNAGKSSLLNAIARREAAIVSEEAGTTRDLVEITVNLGGFPVCFVDTAGLRKAEGAVEREGIRRALERAERADLVVLLRDVTGGAPAMDPGLRARLPAPVVEYGSKADLMPAAGEIPDLPLISARSGAGLDHLFAVIGEHLHRFAPSPERILVTQRQAAALEAACGSLARAGSRGTEEIEIVAEDLREAGNHLGRLTGRVDVEDLLDVIFSRFCIGK